MRIERNRGGELSASISATTLWHRQLARTQLLPRETKVVQWVLSQTLERTPARTRVLIPYHEMVADIIGIRKDHFGSALAKLVTDHLLIVERCKVKFRGRWRRWAKIGVLPVEQWKRHVCEPSPERPALDSAEVLANEQWLSALDADSQIVMEEIVPPTLRDVLLDWNLPMGGAGELPDANRLEHIKDVATSAVGDERRRTDIGGSVSSPTGTRDGVTRREIASGPGNDKQRELDPLEKFSLKYPPVPLPGEKTELVTVPKLGTNSPLTAELPVPNLGTVSTNDPKSGTAPVPNSGFPLDPRAQAVASSGSVVQKLATAQDAIERMARLSPKEWLRFSHIWKPVAEKKPRLLMKMLDELEAEIQRRESGESPEDPISRPLAFLYRPAEDAGLVPRRTRLRSIK